MSTTTDVLLWPYALLKIVVKIIGSVITMPFNNTSPTYGEHLLNAAVRAFLGTPTPSQLQLLLGTSIDSYKADCKKNNLTPNIVAIPGSSAQGFWLGNPEAVKYHMLYIHGGGFVLPLGPDHLSLLKKAIHWSNGNLAVFCVCYTLSPGAIYPTALGQCVEGLRYLLSLPYTSPTTTLVGGDSGGASLAIGVLSHISNHLHPASSTVKPLSITSSLKGALLIAPWITVDAARYPSIYRLAERDAFTKATGDKWLATYKGDSGVPSDGYIEAAGNTASWWAGTKCGPILATTGQDEALVDSVIDWSKKYAEGMGGRGDLIKLAIGQGETHIQPILNPLTETKLEELGEKTQEGSIKAWIEKNLRT